MNWDHVRALNLIDIEFNRDNRREKRVIEAWKAYLDLLNNKSMNENSWNEKRVELLVDLLHQMSKCLDFDFDKTHIKNSSYSPIAHGEADFKQKQIIDGAIEILEGRRDLSIVIKNIEKNDAT
nr:DUF6680 family protein [Sneathiella sp.]